VLLLLLGDMSRFPATAVLLANGPAVIDEVPISSYPKILLPVANRPLFEYQVAFLAAAGVRQIIVCLSADCGHALDSVIDTLQVYGVRIRCITQVSPRGTGGTLKSVEPFIRGDLFWLLGGDLLPDFDLTKLLDFHQKENPIATVAVVREGDPPWRNERVECDDLGCVKAIHRIHPAQSRRTAFRPMGLYLFDRKILAALPPDGYFDLKEQLFSDLYHKATPAKAWEIRDYCRAVSSLDSYMEINRDVLLRRSQFSFLRTAGNGSAAWAAGSHTTRIEPLSIAEGVRGADGVLLVGPACIGPGCEIGDCAIINGSILFPGARIGSGARLTNCIVGEGATVDGGIEIRDRVILGHLRGEADGVGTACLSPARSHIPGETEHSRHGHIALRRGYLLWKRFFDAVFSLAALILLSPLMMLMAIAISLDSPGPVIFRQRRCGYKGVDFSMYKFRTMVNNAEEVKREIRHMNEVDGPMFKITSDPRVTRVGRYLRASNLDELPQFFNILIGKMALVGPRPLSWEEMRFNPRWRDLRITVAPGLIGLWQLKSHTKLSFWDWIHNDIKYVRDCSAWLDFKILVLACVQSIRGFVGIIRQLKHGNASAAASASEPVSLPARASAENHLADLIKPEHK
jgi:lipopolysaccharide/colanic/teichoic acid biosynthesis glycosyltransferase/NDP-sugar pyrophosphorylase family protein